MKATERPSKDNSSPGQRSFSAYRIGTMAVVSVLLLWWLAGGSKPPQMGPEPEVFATVDALFTAVNARDRKLIDGCEQRLRTLRESGKLPEPAADYLDAIIHRVRAEEWQPAAQRLFDFMKAQTRRP